MTDNDADAAAKDFTDARRDFAALPFKDSLKTNNSMDGNSCVLFS